MSFLDPLRDADEEKFLVPDEIYVRDCMRRVFSLFHEDAMQAPRRRPSKAYSAALIGSPGVGKSILFFLAALDQACTSNVVYYRRVGAEAASVFVMTPDTDGGRVRIWFARNVGSLSNEGLKDLRNALKSTCNIDSTEYYTVVDGPKQFDLPNLLDGDYDYFCTSGGLRRYKNDEQEKRLWILDGWNEHEAMTALVALNKVSPATAQQAYFLCGGIIRDVVQACSSYAHVKRQVDQLIDQCDKESVELVVGGTERRGNAPGNPDRLRTMFELRGLDEGGAFHERFRMGACQVVDSPYAIDKLYATLPPERWQEAYDRLIWWIGLGTNTVAVMDLLFSRTSFLD
jgi:Retrotransposon hot spot protein